MSEINLWAIIVATIAAFIVSAIWYVVWSDQMVKLQKGKVDESMPPWKIGVEVLRSLAVVIGIAVILSQFESVSLTSALLVGLILWVAFPVVLLVGSVIHENVPRKLAAIHMGDWLVKLMIITAVVGLWR